MKYHLNCSLKKITENPLKSPDPPPPSPSPLTEGLIETWGLFNLAKTMVSVLHKELCKMKNWKSLGTRSLRSCSRGSKTDPNFQQVNKPSWVSSTQHFTVVID